MKNLLVSVMVVVLGCISASAQNETVYLKDGSIIKGVVVEQVPGVSLKVKTRDGSVFNFPIERVEKISKDASAYNGWSDGNGVERGYRGFIDAGYAFGVGDFMIDRWEFSTSHGYQFCPYLYMGVGAGYHRYDGGGNVVSFFGDIRCDFMDHHISPFVDFRIGGSIADLRGLYLSPSVGCRFGLMRHVAINASLGYSLQRASTYVYIHELVFNLNALYLRVGFEF